MTWATLQQLIRIVLYSGGAYFFGESVADGELFQGLIGGVVATGAFVWWSVTEFNRDVA